MKSTKSFFTYNFSHHTCESSRQLSNPLLRWILCTCGNSSGCRQRSRSFRALLQGPSEKKTAGKWRKCESYFGASTPWLAAWTGHELGGSAPHQCTWAGVVLAPRCRDFVMGWCGGWLFFIDPLFLVNSHFGHSRALSPACSPTAALLHRCFPSNLSTTTQGAIVQLRGAS